MGMAAGKFFRLMIIWNTGPAAMRARHNLKLNMKKEKSCKPQATSIKRLDTGYKIL